MIAVPVTTFALSQQPSAAGQASAAKAESTQHECKDMKGMKEKHGARHGEKRAGSEKHADCDMGAREMQKVKGENGHGHDKSHKHS